MKNELQIDNDYKEGSLSQLSHGNLKANKHLLIKHNNVDSKCEKYVNSNVSIPYDLALI